MRNTYDGIEVIYANEVRKYRGTMTKFINELLKKELCTYQGRKLATKDVLEIKTLQPIYVKNGLILSPTRSPRDYDCLWINMEEVVDYYDEMVIFTNNHKIALSKQRWKTLYNKYLLVAAYLEKYSML